MERGEGDEGREEREVKGERSREKDRGWVEGESEGESKNKRSNQSPHPEAPVQGALGLDSHGRSHSCTRTRRLTPTRTHRLTQPHRLTHGLSQVFTD